MKTKKTPSRTRLGCAKTLTKANLGPFVENGNQVSDIPAL